MSAGPASAAGVGCSDQAPLYYSVGLADVAVAGVTLGVSSTTSEASKSGNVQTVKSTFQTTGLNLPLVGEVALKADAVTVTSTVNYNTVTQTFTNSSSMSVTNLRVGAPLIPPVISLNGIILPDAIPVNIPGVATIGFHRTLSRPGMSGERIAGVSPLVRGVR